LYISSPIQENLPKESRPRKKKEMDPNPSLEYIYYFGFLVSNLFCIGLRKNNVVSKSRRVVVNKLVNILARLCINYSWKILNT
jgi:hypothetical protein